MSEAVSTFCTSHWAVLLANRSRGAMPLVASILLMESLVSDERFRALVDEESLRRPHLPVTVPDGKGVEVVNAVLGNAALARIGGSPCCWVPLDELRRIYRKAGVPEEALP